MHGQMLARDGEMALKPHINTTAALSNYDRLAATRQLCVPRPGRKGWRDRLTAGRGQQVSAWRV
jgi:hypothetical protein